MRAYQARHGLVVDGIIGGKSKARVNASPEDHPGLVLANLERLRWEERLISRLKRLGKGLRASGCISTTISGYKRL